MSNSLERNDRTYGDHTLIGSGNDTFFDKSSLEKALDLAWSDRCPVGVRLTKEPNEGGRGAEVMARRYGQVNFWAGYIKDVFKKNNRQDLLDKFEGARLRKPGEDLGNHDQYWTPKELNSQMIVSPELYSLPRILTTFLDDASNSGYSKQELVVIALDRLDYLAKDAESVRELTVRLAEYLTLTLDDQERMLKAVLSNGKLNEDNCYQDFRSIVITMFHYSPKLFEKYENMSSEERKSAGIADIKN